MGSGDTEAAGYYFRKLYRMTLAGSVVWNILIFLVTLIVMLVYPLSDEIIHLVIVLGTKHFMLYLAFTILFAMVTGWLVNMSL